MGRWSRWQPKLPVSPGPFPTLSTPRKFLRAAVERAAGKADVERAAGKADVGRAADRVDGERNAENANVERAAATSDSQEEVKLATATDTQGKIDTPATGSSDKAELATLAVSQDEDVERAAGKANRGVGNCEGRRRQGRRCSRRSGRGGDGYGCQQPGQG